MKNTKSIKLYFTELIKKATPIAAELIESGLLNLEPGTYTAIEIHKILFRRNRDYVLDNHNKADEFRAKDPAELSEWERNYVRRIDHELGWVKMPIENIFYVIMEYEKSAHIAPKIE